MADKKISQLTDGVTFAAADEIAINRAGTSYKATGAYINTYISAPLQTLITANTTAIGSNAGLVAGISLADQITANLAILNTNTSNISTNTGNISTNTAAIGIHTTNISDNDSDILALQTATNTNTAAIAALPSHPILGTNTAAGVFFGTGTTLAQDTELQWVTATKRLGIGGTPGYQFHIQGSASQYGVIESSANEASFRVDAPASKLSFFTLSSANTWKWQMGTDPTDSDRFKISVGDMLGGASNYVFAIDRATGYTQIPSARAIQFADSGNTHYIGLKAPATVAVNQLYELPLLDAVTSGQALVSNSSGALSFQGLPQLGQEAALVASTINWPTGGGNLDISDVVDGSASPIFNAEKGKIFVINVLNTSTSLVMSNLPNIQVGEIYYLIIKNATAGRFSTTPGDHGSQYLFESNTPPVIGGGTGDYYVLELTCFGMAGTFVTVKASGPFGA